MSEVDFAGIPENRNPLLDGDKVNFAKEIVEKKIAKEARLDSFLREIVNNEKIKYVLKETREKVPFLPSEAGIITLSLEYDNHSEVMQIYFHRVNDAVSRYNLLNLNDSALFRRKQDLPDDSRSYASRNNQIFYSIDRDLALFPHYVDILEELGENYVEKFHDSLEGIVKDYYGGEPELR